MYKEIVFDCRELEAPEPMQLITSNLYKIESDSYIKMVHRMEPQMLFNILIGNGYKYLMKHKNNEVFVYIFEADNSEKEKYLKDLYNVSWTNT